MPSLTFPNSFSPNTTAQSSQVNANFNAVATLLNSTLLANDNIQTGGIATANLAANCVTGAKLASSCADGSTLQYTSSTLSIKASGVATSHLADSAVTTAKLNTGSVTQDKLSSRTVTTDGSDPGAGGVSTSTSCGGYTMSSSTFATVTNMSVTLTTTGRPVRLLLVADGTRDGTADNTADCPIYVTAGASYNRIIYRFQEGSTAIACGQLSGRVETAASTTSWPTPEHIYVPAAGTYTYTFQVRMVVGTALGVGFRRLVAYEI